MHKIKSGSLQLYLKALSNVALEGEAVGKALDKAVQSRKHISSCGGEKRIDKMCGLSRFGSGGGIGEDCQRVVAVGDGEAARCSDQVGA